MFSGCIRIPNFNFFLKLNKELRLLPQKHGLRKTVRVENMNLMCYCLVDDYGCQRINRSSAIKPNGSLRQNLIWLRYHN